MNETKGALCYRNKLRRSSEQVKQDIVLTAAFVLVITACNFIRVGNRLATQIGPLDHLAPGLNALVHLVGALYGCMVAGTEGLAWFPSI